MLSAERRLYVDIQKLFGHLVSNASLLKALSNGAQDVQEIDIET